MSRERCACEISSVGPLTSSSPLPRPGTCESPSRTAARDDLSGIRELFSAYGKDFLGLCYDSGHGNIGGKGIEHLASVKDRLISVHLHDNNGENDEHKPIFSATVDWPRLARIMAESSYDKCVSMESSMRNAGTEDEKVFLDLSFETGTRFARMIADARRETSGH